MQCNLAGCSAQVAFDATTGRVHDFCNAEHARQAMQKERWPRPVRQQSTSKVSSLSKTCGMRGCNLPVCIDPQTKRVHDYCGRSHALQDATLKSQRASTQYNAPQQSSNSSSYSTSSSSSSAPVFMTGFAIMDTSDTPNVTKRPHYTLPPTHPLYNRNTATTGLAIASLPSLTAPTQPTTVFSSTSTSTAARSPGPGSGPGSVLENDVCSICLDSYINGSGLIKTTCSHVFHKKCVDEWLSTNKVSLYAYNTSIYQYELQAYTH